MVGAARGGVWLVLGAVGSLQFGASLAATLFDELGATGTAFVRIAVSAVVLTAIWPPRLRGHPPRDIGAAALFGLVLGGMNTCFYLALDRIPQGIAVTFEMVGPLTLALVLSRRRLDALWVALAGTGIGLLSGGDIGHIDPLGIGLALGAGTLWALYILLSVRVGKSFPAASGLALAMVVAAVATAPGGIVDAGGTLGDVRLLALGAAVALLSSVIPYTLELEALRRMSARLFGVLMSLGPGLAALAGFLILDQRLSALEMVAIVLVIAASAGVTVTARQARIPAVPETG